jgi:glutamyl-tRNA synthetase
MITRFAPSPTGLLHLGNARTALIAYLYAKSCQGKFLLRIDDTDTLRSNQYYIEQIIEDLKWLNIKFDDIFFQSKRFVRYKEVLEHLIVGRQSLSLF